MPDGLRGAGSARLPVYNRLEGLPDNGDGLVVLLLASWSRRAHKCAELIDRRRATDVFTRHRRWHLTLRRVEELLAPPCHRGLRAGNVLDGGVGVIRLVALPIPLDAGGGHEEPRTHELQNLKRKDNNLPVVYALELPSCRRVKTNGALSGKRPRGI